MWSSQEGVAAEGPGHLRVLGPMQEASERPAGSSEGSPEAKLRKLTDHPD